MWRGPGLRASGVGIFLPIRRIRPRGVLVGILVSVWGLRLAWHIHARHRAKAEDYATWPGDGNGQVFYVRSYAQVYLLQGALLFLVSLPVLMINRRPSGTLSLLDSIGVCIGCLVSFSNRWVMPSSPGCERPAQQG